MAVGIEYLSMASLFSCFPLIKWSATGERSLYCKEQPFKPAGFFMRFLSLIRVNRLRLLLLRSIHCLLDSLLILRTTGVHISKLPQKLDGRQGEGNVVMPAFHVHGIGLQPDLGKEIVKG